MTQPDMSELAALWPTLDAAIRVRCETCADMSERIVWADDGVPVVKPCPECAAGDGEGTMDEVEIKACIDWDNDTVYYYYAKGKLDPQAFSHAVGTTYGFDASPRAVRHTYLRYGVSAYAKENGGMEIFEYDKPGRGRFQATVYDFDRE